MIRAKPSSNSNHCYKSLTTILSILISSKTRIKLLLKFFLNSANKAYLRGLAQEFGESTNAIRLELNKLEGAGMLCSEYDGNKKYFSANQEHPLFSDIQNIVRKYVGIDQIIDQIVNDLGAIKKIYLTGDWAKGKESEVIDLCLVGHNLNKVYLLELIEKTEHLIGKKIKYLIYQEHETLEEGLLIWHKE